MRRLRAVAVLVFILTIVAVQGVLAQEANPEATAEVMAAAQEATPEVLPAVTQPQALPVNTATPVTETLYVVRSGETLFRIAVRFGTTVRMLAEANGIANPSLIYAGQTLRIPGTSSPIPPTAQPPATVVPAPTENYIVQRGDTLFRIAVRFRTTVRQLVTLNSLANPNFIYSGQVLRVPTQAAAGTTPPVALVPTATPLTSLVGQGGGQPAPGYGFAYGIEAFLVDQDVAALTSELSSLGVTWVKQEIAWRDFEPTQGNIDFDTLDNIVNTLRASNINILLTVSAAPSWARSNADENGPPDNFADYGAFLGALAARYAGQVQAYEIWTEPNLRREWNSSLHSISPAKYVELLGVAYNAVKASDPNAVVISAGLAPTGFNDGVNAINDRQFLAGIYTAGGANVSDAIGAHPNGWANPPDALCCTAPVGVETHFEDASFYFQETLRAYRDIMVNSGDGSTAIWVTKFGWGTSEDTDAPSQSYIYVTYTSLGEQAIYNPRGFELGAELGFVGPMFLYNFNACGVGATSADSCYYSLIGPGGATRPAFDAVRSLIAGEAQPTLEAVPPIAEITPEVTLEVIPEGTVEIIPTLEPLPTQESIPTFDPAATADPGSVG